MKSKGFVDVGKYHLITLDKLIKAAWNYKEDDPALTEKLKTNIKRNGQIENIIVRELETGYFEVVNGNHRLDALRDLNCEAVYCYNLGPINESQAKRIAVETNETRFKSNDDRFSKVILDLKADFSLSDLSSTMPFTEQELEKLLDPNAGKAIPKDTEPQIEKADELNKKWKCKRGDIWLIGDHRLVCGDSSLRDDVEKLMNGKRATCVFTDPPYGVSIGDKNKMLNAIQPSKRCTKNLESDNATVVDLSAILLKAFTLCREIVMADNCAIFVCSPMEGELGMMMMMKDAGLPTKHIINWVKNAATFSMGRLDYDYQHEPILFTWKKTHKRFKAGQFQTSCWTVDRPRKCDVHPTMKPVELPINAILNHTETNDLVVDVFGGSGTTMIAAENTKRKSCMMEFDPKYCAVILQRMKDTFPNLCVEKMNQGAEND